MHAALALQLELKLWENISLVFTGLWFGFLRLPSEIYMLNIASAASFIYGGISATLSIFIRHYA
jgi:hypothetical protein